MPVSYEGPIFDGSIEKHVDDLLVGIGEAIGREGVNRVKTALHGVLQNPTGSYESQIQTELQQNDLDITDGGVIHGPWLEGVGSRNATSRFKGYGTFRKVHQALENEAIKSVTDPVSRFMSKAT